jgi:hypothetical protein
MTDLENRLRAKALDQGQLLIKSPSHNKQARNYGKFVLVPDKAGNRLRAQAVWQAWQDGGLTLEEVAGRLR